MNISINLNISVFDETIGSLLAKSKALTCTSDTPIGHVAILLRDARSGCIIIVDNDIVTGIFTERDYIVKIAGLEHELSNKPVAAFMVSNPITRPTTTKIFDAIKLMKEKKFRNLIVVDDKNKLLNVVSSKTIIDRVTEVLLQK